MTTRFPEWIRRSWASGANVQYTKGLVEDNALHTVCQSARCPNIHECWSRKTATFMVLGNVCSRNCRYCSVPSGKPEPPDADEPGRVADAVRKMGLLHTVLTSVTRDDLSDGGAAHIAETIRAIRRVSPSTTVEVLVPDFQGDPEAICQVLDAHPEVFSHNIETVARLHPVIRSRRYTYAMALGVLKEGAAYRPQPIIKSAFMVGHGETAEEVRSTLEDLVEAGCDAVSIGQYLRPTPRQRAVESFVRPEEFEAYQRMAYDAGFKFAVAGAFVRSSYRSDELMEAPFARERVRAQRRASA